MKVLNSSTAFREHYARRANDVLEGAKAIGAGGLAAGGVTASSALAVGHAAAGASLWSLGSGLPLVGSILAGKATAVGIAAGTAAVGSAAVILPALLIGGGVAYAVYRNRKKAPIQKASAVEEVANAFARVACLPMLALAVSFCRANPASADAVEGYLQRELGAWGYAESYIRDGFAEAMRHSPEELNDGYEWMIGQLKSGSTAVFGVAPAELPVDAVRGFAEDFKKAFEANLG